MHILSPYSKLADHTYFVFYNQLLPQIRLTGRQIDNMKRVFERIPSLVNRHRYDRLIVMQRIQRKLQARVLSCLQSLRLGLYDDCDEKKQSDSAELTAVFFQLKQQFQDFKKALFKERRPNKIL
jgi:hypothetical protein